MPSEYFIKCLVPLTLFSVKT